MLRPVNQHGFPYNAWRADRWLPGCIPGADSESKWRQLGELALNGGQLEVAQRCFAKAKDLGGLLLLHSSHADAGGMAELAQMAGGWMSRAGVSRCLMD
jgi:hypothetical protein